MNEIAEKGLAAHWKYKEGANDESRFDKWFQQIREVLNTQDNESVRFFAGFQAKLSYRRNLCLYTKGGRQDVASRFFGIGFCFFNSQCCRSAVHWSQSKSQIGSAWPQTT